jgi:Ser/Thr protein kinase RdoA (MazF antagonist)
MNDKINSICEREFGVSLGSTKQIFGGLNSETYRIGVKDSSYILQLTSNSEPHELENCVRSFDFLKETQVPVPTSFTDGVKDFESSHYVIVEDLPGEAITKVTDSSITERAGRYLALIHNSKSFEKEGWIEWENGEPEVLGFEEGSLQARVKQLMQERLEFCREYDMMWLAEIIEKFLQRHADKLPEDFKPVFVHHDFNPGNTLVENGEITGILDLDYAHSSHSHRDLAKAANKFWLRGGDRGTLYKGYEKERELENFEDNRDLYLLESLVDELVSMIEHEHMTPDECEKYEEELLRLEQKISI